jgi:putative acetyltransferase
VIRRAIAQDGPTIAVLFRRSFGTLTFLPTLHTPEEDREFFSKLVRDREVWVWEEDGLVLGFAALGEDELEQFYVEPEAFGSGIGSALLDRAKERRPQGFRFWVFQRNERARAFYERHGCRLVELADGSGNEEREPDALYEWRPEERK